MILQSGHDFAHAMTAQLSWQVQQEQSKTATYSPLAISEKIGHNVNI